MSLILDSLKKINRQTQSVKAVPPSLLNLSPSASSKPNKKLLILLAVSVLLFAATFLIPEGGSQYKVNPAPRPQQTQPMNQPVNQAIVQPAPQESAPAPKQADMYDPTAANRQRLIAMQGLPEINSRKAETQATAPDHANGKGLVQSGMPQTEPIQQSEPQPAQTLPAPYSAPQTPVLRSNPSNVLTGRAKQEYDEKIDYNTKMSQASEALDSGNNRRAEELFSSLLAEKPSKYALSGLLTAKIRSGKTEDIIPSIERYRRSADASVISSAAQEMAGLGQKAYALDMLSRYTDMANSGQIYYTAALIHESEGNAALAEKLYTKASASSPADPYYMYALARCKDIQGKYKESVDVYAKVLNLNASDSIKKLSNDRITQLTAYLDSAKQ